MLAEIWSYSVMVITVDSESTDPGSSPGRTSNFFPHAFDFQIAQEQVLSAVRFSFLLSGKDTDLNFLLTTKL